MHPLSTHLFMAYKAETDEAKRWTKKPVRKKEIQTHPNKDNSATARKMDGKHAIQRRMTGGKEQEKQGVKK